VKVQTEITVSVGGRPTHGDYEKAEPHALEWPLMEMASRGERTCQVLVSTMPPTIQLKPRSRWPNTAGSWNGITRSGNKSGGWDTLKAATGAGFTSCHALHGSLWVPGGRADRFSLRPEPAIFDSLSPGRGRTSGHAGRRVHPERHNAHSIATLRYVLARLLVRQ
jgi:hypothetical protein